MTLNKYFQNVLLGSVALGLIGARYVPSMKQSGPVLTAAVAVVSAPSVASSAGIASDDGIGAHVANAVTALRATVRPLSHPRALETAFASYFAYKTAHPRDVKKPYLYFVDYGLPSTEPRGYVFDMETLEIVDGPFTVAHGRGSSASRYGVPTRFSNRSGAATTSLGLYLTANTYNFTGHSAGGAYRSIGLVLLGQSEGYNDNAKARGVVAHGAPYVTPDKAGRSEGCPAIEQARAQKLLPKLANGAMVFLFAPDNNWLAGDPWVASSGT